MVGQTDDLIDQLEGPKSIEHRLRNFVYIEAQNKVARVKEESRG